MMTPIAVLLVSLSLLAGDPHPSTGIVDVKAPRVSLEAGSRITALVRVTVKDGYHIQSDSAVEDYLIPTVLTFPGENGIVVEKVSFPPGVPLAFNGVEEPWSVFDGTFDILVTVGVSKGVDAGNRALKAALRYQACDLRSCFPPVTLEFDIPIEVL